MSRVALIRSLLLLALLVGGQWLSVVHAQSHDVKPQTSDSCELCLLASAHGSGATTAPSLWLAPAASAAPGTAPGTQAAAQPAARPLIRGPPALNTH